jgi:hypothetical protein
MDTSIFVFSPEKSHDSKYSKYALRSLATKLHILARQADIFGINHFTSR